MDMNHKTSDSTHTNRTLPVLHIIGGGMAGCEAAWQALQQGCHVVLHEMRPQQMTAAHQTAQLAELVCSNSLKSISPQSAPGQLKTEMAAMRSLIVEAGYHARVPAGQALAVDRQVFSRYIHDRLTTHPHFTLEVGEVTELPTMASLEERNECWIIATGPLTSQSMAQLLEKHFTPSNKRLFFYDAIAPVIDADSIDYDIAFRASRYDKNQGDSTPQSTNSSDSSNGQANGGDYLNLPMNKEEYEAFIDALLTAEYMPLHEFEETKYFESCLPIEVMVERGRETLRFGPMKPVGITDPRTGRRPWANVQLRQENKDGTMFSMVGFQTKMKWPEQRRVFAMIPGLAQAEFLRYGSVHRNTYLQSPSLLNEQLAFKAAPRIYLAGQITGVEGYTESAAMGLLAGRAAAATLRGQHFLPPPETTVIGALHQYVTKGGLGDFQPMNANLGLLPSIKRQRGESKQDKKAKQCELARLAFEAYAAETGLS